MNIVLVVKDRPNLTRQCLGSLVKNTDVEWNLMIVDDGSKPPTGELLKLFASVQRKRVALLINPTSRGILGQVKNLGVYWSEKFWGRGDYLYLSDNDAYFLPGWSSRMIPILGWGFDLLGGQNHPYHQPIETAQVGVREYEALAGTSWLMRWETWDKYGPLDANAIGICKGEDHEFCQRIRKDGGKVGAVYPHVVLDCSLTDTFGKPAVGAETKTERVEGVEYE